MTEYALYVESGPKRRTTQVHVLDLLGCVAVGPTTDAALGATPDTIRAYLRLLQAHGEPVDPGAPFTTAVAAHVTAGPWIGQGDPVEGFAPDFAPLAPDDLARYLRWSAAIRAGLLSLIRATPPERFAADPAAGSRTMARIVEHISEAGAAYVRSTVGAVDGLSAALRAVRESRPEDLPATLPRVWEIEAARLAAMSEDERARQIPHGRLLWTARRGLRRLLEHEWEHLQELTRLAAP
jgi:uncharacterized damage-inducible protein DinB/predicted RNase H-like HicB family nuclease